MLLTSWLRKSKPSRICRSAAAPSSIGRFRPSLEVLEDRWTPATLTVTTANDVVNPNDAVVSLREAISAASNRDTINFDTSLSNQTILLNQGELLINKTVNIVGLGADHLTVSGGNVSRVFEVAARAKVTISGLTITNGHALYSSSTSGLGGAVLNWGTLTLNNCSLSNNFALYNGGGIYNAGTLTVSACTITGNSVGDVGSNHGGGIYNAGTATVTNSTLSNNMASNSDTFGNCNGGGIYNFGGATLTVSFCTFTENVAGDEGGGIYNAGTLKVSESTFSGNDAGGTMGTNGGDGIMNRGSLTISNCTFIDDELVNLGTKPGKKK